MNQNVVSAVFDDRAEAERAVTELRSAGIQDSAISLLGRPDEESDGGSTARDDDDDGASKGSVAASVVGGGVAVAILGVAALAIPGVGPLAAAGAIAASAVPTGAAVGAAVGATGGAIARMLTDHDVDGQDAEYYAEHIDRGGIFVSVDTRLAEGQAEAARDILYRNGGHSASRSKTAFSALDGRDDPNRGPLDRAANALDGRDDPNRGPVDRAENALDRNS